MLTFDASGAPRGNIQRAQAYWVTEDTIAWKPGAVQPGWTVALRYGAGRDIPLTWDEAGLSGEVPEKLPHLAGC
ncbi:MAG: hypothetical protein ACLGI9_09475, partial [Thermoanaerobaculia bacterium]